MIVGTLFGLAFAPKKGKELRKDLKEELDKGGNGKKLLKNTATEMSKDVAATAKELYQDPSVQKQINKGKTEIGKVVKDVKQEITKKKAEFEKLAKGKIKETKEKIQDGIKHAEHEASATKPHRAPKKKS
jgi:gas vesicle protein